MSISSLVYADTSAELYQVELPVASTSLADWQKALAPALQQVLVKISGNPQIINNPAIRGAMAKPDALVQSFNYVSSNTAGQNSQLLRVRFSPQGIDNLLQSANQSLTPATTTALTPAAAGTQPPKPQTASVQLVNMQISGVNGLQDYTDVYNYLRHLDGVMDVDTTQMNGDQMAIVVKINTSADALAQQIAAAGKLVPQTNASSSAQGSFNYRWTAGVGPAVTAAPITTVPSINSTAPSAPTVPAKPIENTPLSPANSGVIADPKNTGQTFAAPPLDTDFRANTATTAMPEEVSPD